MTITNFHTACMRMRKLGHGQSVVFCVPEEIQTKIVARTSKSDNEQIEVSDVLLWAISETCVDIRRSMPLWAAQGQRFITKSALWDRARVGGGYRMSKDEAEKFLENESQSLEDRYRPRSATGVTSFIEKGNNKHLDLIVERCEEFNGLEFNSATLQEEQERELSPEIEQERQVQRPARAEPAPHHLHPDVTQFVSLGNPVRGSKGYIPAFEALRNTSAAAHLDVSQFPQDLLVTVDFASTIQTGDFGRAYVSDSYQRPVQWILTSTGSGESRIKIVKYMMIISPFEAQELLPQIKQSQMVTLHLYAPRLNRGFPTLDGLDLYSVPARPIVATLPRNLIVQLNLFAGQLYLSSFKEYVEVCETLGLAWKPEDGCVVAADGFIVSGKGDGKGNEGFKDSPVKFLQVLMTKIRRNCESIDKTDLGNILEGSVLTREYFKEMDSEVVCQPM
jgi:hypothetical protein